MSATRRRLVRRLETPAGTRYLVQVPQDREVTPGWHRYELLVLGPHDAQPLRLTLHERTAVPRGNSDGPQAA